MNDARRRDIVKRLLDKGCGKAQAVMFLKAFEERKMADDAIDAVLAKVDFTDRKAASPAATPASSGPPLRPATPRPQAQPGADLEALVSKVAESDISSIQNVTSGIIKIINDPRSTVADLKRIIEVDPALTAKILRIANSAKFFAKEPICNIERAVIWIGFESLKELTLNQKVCEIFQKGDAVHGFSRMGLWKHCVAVGVMGKIIARRELGKAGENVYAAGLLHDIGIIAEDQFLDDLFPHVLARAHKGEPFREAERAVLSFEHGAVGGRIADFWKLPPDIVEAIHHHHTPFRAAPEHQEPTYVLHIADHLCFNHGYGYGTAKASDMDGYQKCLNALGIKRHSAEMLAADMAREMAHMEREGVFNNE